LRSCVTGRTGEAELDKENWTAEQDCQDRTPDRVARIVLPGQNCYDKITRQHLKNNRARKESKNRTARTGQSERDSQNKITRTRQSEHDNQTGQAEQDRQNRLLRRD
jgi:hypothetical protein